MQLINLTQQPLHSTVKYAFREWDIQVSLSPDAVTFDVTHDFTERARIILSQDEILPFTETLLTFFTLTDQRRFRFNYNAPTQEGGLVPQMRLSTTNWGEPYANGLRFEFSDNIAVYGHDELYFDLESDDARDLLEKLERVCAPLRALHNTDEE